MAEKSPRRGPVKVAEALPPSMRSQDEELQVRHKALKAARKKAKADAKEQKEEDRMLQREDWKMMKVYPAKCYVAPYPLKERSGGMICRDQWYRYGIPEDRDDMEVTLQLWRKPSGRPSSFDGVVGDLYSLFLEIPNGSGMELHIIVKSAEARLNPSLLLQFSVFDMGNGDKAYSVEYEAWQNYLLFREESNKEDLDSRLLYHAVCNRWEVGAMPLNIFTKLATSDIIIMMQGMTPGGDYPRPTVAESQLATIPPPPEPTPEMLRAQEADDADLEQEVSEKVDLVMRRKYGRRPSFKEITDYEEMVAKNLGYSPKKLKRKRLVHPYSRRDTCRFHPDVERQMNRRLNKFLDDYIDPEKKLGPTPSPNQLSINDVENPVETMKYVDRQLEAKLEVTPPNSPQSIKTLESWSGSGWVTEDDQDSKESCGGSDEASTNGEAEDEEVTIVPLNQYGRIMGPTGFEGQIFGPALQPRPTFKPETSWEASHKAEKDYKKAKDEEMAKLDETVTSLASSLSGIDVMDRSSDLETSNPRDATTSSDDARNKDDEDSLPSLNDSVEVFLAKRVAEEEIITLDTSSSSGDTTPDDEPKGGADTNAVKQGSGEFSIQGRRFQWMAPAQAALYPGGFVDDLILCGVPRELWPFPVDGQNEDTKDEDTPTDDGCSKYKHADEED